MNLARRFELDVEGSPWTFSKRSRPDGRPPHSAVFAWPELGVVAASPELCLSLEPDGTARTTPIKGTRPRHPEPERDRALASELDANPKERAELAMVIERRAERSRPGGASRQRPARRGAAASRATRRCTIAWRPWRRRFGRTSRATSCFRAMLPSGSVTGAPKIRAMEVIAELEPVAPRALHGRLRRAPARRRPRARHGHPRPDRSRAASGSIIRGAASSPTRTPSERSRRRSGRRPPSCERPAKASKTGPRTLCPP